MSDKKAFIRRPESNGRKPIAARRDRILRMALYSDPRWLSTVLGAVAREVLQLSRLIKIFEVYDNEEQALAS